MDRNYTLIDGLAVILVIILAGSAGEVVIAHEAEIEEIKVWGQKQAAVASHSTGPDSVLTPEDMVSINAATTEDLVKYEPSLVIRRRFIGDANGTMGMRGSNMFQTTRSMVFADGVPLHYFLQTRWNGSPRWSLVSADEIARVEVIYGPFSAEYSGNAMGGVVNIETAIPTEREIHIKSSVFNQNFNALGYDGDLQGYKGFVSYGNTFDNISVFASYNRMENESQPQNFLFSPFSTPDGGEENVSGAILNFDNKGDDVLYFGNDGSVDATTDNLKFKIGYDKGKWSSLFNIAYERRNTVTDSPRNYLTTANGTTIWDGTVVQNGSAFQIRSENFSVSEQDRKSLLLGGRLQGNLTGDWLMEINLSYFSILEDEIRESLANPLDPAHTPAGEITDHGDTGWKTAEIKFRNDRLFGNRVLDLVTGYRYEHYSLAIGSYDSADYAAGVMTTLTGSSGGETGLHAVYAQAGWQITENWDVAAGGRLEYWKSRNGFVDGMQHPDRSESRFSPKFSVGFAPGNKWDFRYSVARAYRFPITEELFQNVSRTQGTSLADAGLEPENGLHHNLMLQHSFNGGYARINLFHENIDNAIFAQTTVVDNRSLNTFIPIDTVRTSGVEFIYNQIDFLDTDVDIRFNTTYTDSEITGNSVNPALEGKTFPRMPKWRANLLLTWHVNERWDIGGGLRYSGNSYGELDNTDTANNVYGAMDSFTFVNFKTTYRIHDSIDMSLGLDNLLDDRAYVHHPWPGRTVFLEAALQL